MKFELNKTGKIIIGFFVIVLFSGFFPGKDDLYFEIAKNIELFGKVYKEISLNYVDEVDPEEFMKAGIEGMLESLDPYTIFIDENKKDEIDLITSGKYGGVGVSIGVRGEKVTVIEVLDGYSAQKQGIRIGDVLIEAAGTKISPENLDDISSLVKGEPGTTVGIKVLRNGNKDTLSFNLIREEVIVKNLIYAGFYPEDSNTAYLKLSNFSRSAGDEIRVALKKLKEEKEIKSIIFDLRGNPGGLLDVAVDICEKFLPKDQLIVTTLGRDEESKKEYFSVQEPLVGDARLALLVNGGSASASEIVTGAIQDHDRGIIIGEKTFGKGLVQTIAPLNYNTSLKITTAKYYTPSGRCIQKVDYSKDNKVISDVDSLIHTTFLTDNEREVFSAGGISPDSVVSFNIEGDITKDLLAKGFFFMFADYYYYNNPEKDFYQINNEEVLNKFNEYVANQNFVYKSEVEKELDKLISDVEKKKYSKDMIENLEGLKSKFENLGLKEIDLYKDEIIMELRQELAARYLGKEGRIKEMLKYDNQFQVALNVLNNQEVYNKILKSH